MNAEVLQNINWQSVIVAFLTSALFQGIVIYALKIVLNKIALKNTDTTVKANEIGFNVELLLESGDKLNHKLDKTLQLQKDLSQKDDEILEYQKKSIRKIVEKTELLNDIKKTVDDYLKED